MRIIAGTHRGRKLLPPAGEATRPVTDRVKQSLFDALAAEGRLDGAAVLDVFAGTGSFGLECLSRGATSATFYERDPSALDRLRRNVATLGVAAAATIQAGDIYAARFPAADLVFLDPPYAHLREKAADLAALVGRLRADLNPGGVILLRHDARDAPPPAADGSTPAGRVWGKMAVSRYTADA